MSSWPRSLLLRCLLVLASVLVYLHWCGLDSWPLSCCIAETQLLLLHPLGIMLAPATENRGLCFCILSQGLSTWVSLLQLQTLLGSLVLSVLLYPQPYWETWKFSPDFSTVNTIVQDTVKLLSGLSTVALPSAIAPLLHTYHIACPPPCKTLLRDL